MIGAGERNPPGIRPGATRAWSANFARRLLISDLLVLVWVIFGVQIAWFGFGSPPVSFSGNMHNLAVGYAAVSAVLIAAWMAMLHAYGTRDCRVVGGGPAEYKLIAGSAISLFGLVAIVAYLFQVELARGYILIAFPLGIVVLVFSRWMWRQWLTVQRMRGEYSARVLLVGSEETASHIARELAKHPEEGYRVVGACVPSAEIGSVLPGTDVPIVGRASGALRALQATDADTVAVTSSGELGPEGLRRLSWGLESGRQHLIVAPALTDVSGPRIHTRPVAGLPLIHVETPRFEGGKHFAKRAFDIAGSSALIVALSPMLIALSMIVAASSAGPVFYKQDRVGLNGECFRMLKFRSMRMNADEELPALLKQQGRGDSPLFKVENDPRVTPIGRLLRRHSLDEFPQLLNVLLGHMSLVGPRPQREEEVALYDSAAHRRLLLKPGMSGLWQVGGRSSLSWEDSIRLDLYYVENWSITGDVVILWRTLKAVLRPGADAQ
jgi:exopolysaccharide biosynthesis polyprenyl glycosylphosphotransferase